MPLFFKKTKAKDAKARENVEALKKLQEDTTPYQGMNPGTRADLDAINRAHGHEGPSKYL